MGTDAKETSYNLVRGVLTTGLLGAAAIHGAIALEQFDRYQAIEHGRAGVLDTWVPEKPLILLRGLVMTTNPRII
jgi:hypothetical protein